MLYALYEWHRNSLMPLRFMAEAGQRILSDPNLPFAYSHAGRAAAATCEMVERSTRNYKRPGFGIAETLVGGKPVAVAEEIILAKPFCELRRFARDTKRKDPKVLLVAPMSGHYATLLRGTVLALLPDHDVYVTDWLNARDVPLSQGAFDLDDYVDYVIEFLQKLGPKASVIAVCQPSVPVLMAASAMAAARDPMQPASMILMGGPIDTRVNPTKVNTFATARPLEWFEKTVVSPVPFGLPSFGRKVYPGFLQLSGFMSMNIDRHLGAHMRMYHHLIKGDGDSAEAHRKFYDEYMSVMDLTAEFYLQTVKRVFQDHDLPLGRMRWRGVPVDPGAIVKTALFTIEGELDDISATGQTKAAHDLCRNIPRARRKHLLQERVGHYGIFNGKRWREQIYPQVRDFIRLNA
ncbi:MAG: polyhydroxyalkanoate depolymerase [Alphaproteobacteria bacterium]